MMHTPTRARAVATTVARSVRRIPGGEQVAGRAALRLRSSRLAREVVSRVFDLGSGSLGGTVFLSGGDLLSGIGLDDVPVVVVALVGVDAEDVPEVLETVAREQVLTAGFRPVVVMDADALGAARHYGYPVELLVRRDVWADDEPWEQYVSDRIASLRRHYGAAGLVAVRDVADLHLVSGFLGSLRSGGEPGRSEGR